mgnify:CR=1 FL=1
MLRLPDDVVSRACYGLWDEMRCRKGLATCAARQKLDKAVKENPVVAERLMYGSDWPVCLLAGEYEKFLEVMEKFTDSLSFSEKDKIMGETAAEFYRIG